MKKKLLIFIQDGSFTYDHRVQREVDALLQTGWDITIISPKTAGDPFYKRINEYLRAFYYPMQAAGCSVIFQLIERFCSLFFGVPLTFWIFLRYGFTVFHACNPIDVLWLIAWPYKLFSVKFVFDQHDLCPELLLSQCRNRPNTLLYQLLIWFEKVSYRFADVVIVPNESYKEIAFERGCKKPSEVFVVRNGPDLDRFCLTLPPKNMKKEGEILVGYLGNMNQQDGVEYLLEAASIIVSEHGRANISFILIGGGSAQLRLAEKTIEMGLSSKIVFTGRLPDKQMVATLSACDICVQPDPFNPLNDKSTMNKAMEYMALAKPVIAFDLKETRISCGDAAIYVTTNSVKDLSEKILFLVDNPNLREELGKRGRIRIERKLSWKFSIPHLLSAYNSFTANVSQKQF